MSSTVNKEELLSRLKQDSIFIDELVNLFPPKAYLGSQQQNASSKYMHGTSEKAAAKRESRENRKKAKRLKLDPSAPRTTLEIQKSLHEGKDDSEQEDSDGIEDDVKKPENGAAVDPDDFFAVSKPAAHPSGRAASIEELRERLQQRLEAFKSARKGDENTSKARSGKDSNKPKKPKGKKNNSAENNQKLSGKAAELAGRKKAEAQQKVAPEPVPELRLQFGRIEGSDPKSLDLQKRKKKPKTERLLAKAAALQEKLSHDNEDNDGKASKHAWEAAVGRASGQKVLDDPKLLKKTLRRENSQRRKSAKTWEDRKSQQSAVMNAKQKKRKDNLQYRVDKKKQTKIAKREKKLMRPGFEGRAKSVINKAPEKSD